MDTATLRAFEELDGRDLGRWSEFAATNPDLDSPFFDPSYFRALGQAGSPVLVAVLRDASRQANAFVPLTRRRRSLYAGGSPGADFQGPVCAPGYRLDVRGVLRAAGLRRLHFDHLRANAHGFEGWHPVPAASPYLDVSGGTEAYLSRAGSSARGNLGQARRKVNHLVRDHGAVSIDTDCRDPRRLDELIELKRGQYRRTSARDHFADPSHRALLHRLLAAAPDDSVRGVLTVITAGPRLVAGHFGMRRGGVLHWWFPVYDPEFARYAPGWMLLRELIAAAPEMGLTRLDLGRGEAEYKRRAMTGQQVVHEVRVELNPLARAAGRVGRDVTARVRSSRLAPTLKRVVHGAL